MSILPVSCIPLFLPRITVYYIMFNKTVENLIPFLDAARVRWSLVSTTTLDGNQLLDDILPRR